MQIQNLWNFKRRRFLINPKFQFTFMFFMGGISFAAVIVMFSSYFYFFWELKSIGVKLGLPMDSPYFVYINRQQYMLGNITLVTSLVLSVVILIVGLLFSHRICGPLRRLEKHLIEISKIKQLSPLKFRKGDFFQELPDAFNQMVASFEAAPKSQK